MPISSARFLATIHWPWYFILEKYNIDETAREKFFQFGQCGSRIPGGCQTHRWKVLSKHFLPTPSWGKGQNWHEEAGFRWEICNRGLYGQGIYATTDFCKALQYGADGATKCLIVKVDAAYSQKTSFLGSNCSYCCSIAVALRNSIVCNLDGAKTGSTPSKPSTIGKSTFTVRKLRVDDLKFMRGFWHVQSPIGLQPAAHS